MRIYKLTKKDFENVEREYTTVKTYPLGSAVDKMFGLDVVQLTNKETKNLLEGEFLYISNGEYSTCIRAGEIAKVFEKAREGGENAIS